MRDNDYSLNQQICMCTWDGRTDGRRATLNTVTAFYGGGGHILRH